MIDLGYLRTTIGNDTDVIKEIINLFISQLPDLQKDILSSYENKNWKAFRDAAHKAKNSFNILGIKNTADKLRRIEILADEKTDNPEFKILIADFLDASEMVLKEIDELVI